MHYLMLVTQITLILIIRILYVQTFELKIGTRIKKNCFTTLNSLEKKPL